MIKRAFTLFFQNLEHKSDSFQPSRRNKIEQPSLVVIHPRELQKGGKGVEFVFTFENLRGIVNGMDFILRMVGNGRNMTIERRLEGITIRRFSNEFGLCCDCAAEEQV